LGLKEIPILETQPEIAADSPTRNSNLSGRRIWPLLIAFRGRRW